MASFLPRCFLLALVAAGSSTAAGVAYVGRELSAVLDEVRANGLPVVYSSAVVPRGLRIDVEPTSDTDVGVLREILPSLGLALEPGPGDVFLVVRDPRPRADLAGVVSSRSDGSAIPGAEVRLGGRARSLSTARDGGFRFPGVLVGGHDLVVTAVGHETTRVRVTLDDPSAGPFRIVIGPRSTFVTDVTVTPGRHSIVDRDRTESRTLTRDDVLAAPALGNDVGRILDLLPGISTDDGSGAFRVRGGEVRDVSLVLDGLELYDPFHLRAFQSPFSLVDGSIIDRIDLFAGGFPVDRGDRHGGFVEISTDDPGTDEATEVELGTLNSRVTRRSGAEDGPGSWLVSARAWYPDSVFGTTQLGREEGLSPELADLYAKYQRSLSARVLLSGHALVGVDRLQYRERGEDVNETVSARTRNGYLWFRVIRAGSSSESTTTFSGGRIESRRRGLASGDRTAFLVLDRRETTFAGVRHDSRIALRRWMLKTGAEVRSLRAHYDYRRGNVDSPDEDDAFLLDPSGTSASAYVSVRREIGSMATAELGVRWDRQTHTNDNQLSPRMSVMARTGPRSEVRLAAGRYHQSQRIHELRVEDGESAFGRSEVSEQASLSFLHRFLAGPRFRLDTYFRRLSSLQPRFTNLFEPIELFPEVGSDRISVSPDESRLRGVELLVGNDSGPRWRWSASYALAAADDVIDGREVPRDGDRTHALKVLAGYRSGDRWSVSIAGIVRSGVPTTPVTGSVEDGEVEAVPGLRNSARLPGYGRIDLEIRRGVSLRRGTLGLTLQVSNLTDRANACCIDEFVFEPGPRGPAWTGTLYDEWPGITPSVSLSLEF